MIVLAKKELGDYWGLVDPKAPYFVMCITDEPAHDKPGLDKYYYTYSRSVHGPYRLPASLFAVVDDDVPSDWIVTRQERQHVHSFPEWANDRHFYNYLLENEWKPRKTTWANQVLEKEYEKYLDDFVMRKFGSTQNFYKRFYDFLNETRGFEKPDDDAIGEQIKRQHLNLDDAWNTPAA